ncbi:MEMO1 family protein [Desulfosarcina alkanivorans]|uniref:MEMO1 family protein DSCA_31810 n=1 Tax=Desulfosarcina alkanivorans TaxID=571177 RepID=A0A5K7YQK7_9BACT|nr:AmmeMemoRadiSam system protein B [Desulfosarcina alkanivorans]BBO69251.1 MEMO1 family protein [Desulfosarcina alkanivorans]
MSVPRCLVIFEATLILWCLLSPQGIGCGAVRDPVWAGKFYPEDRNELDRLIRRLSDTAARGRDVQHPPAGLRALIMPHAGYAYSGATAAHAVLAIVGDRFDRVVLLGPDHRVGFRNGALTGASHWRTPLGLVPVGDLTPLLKDRPDLFARVDASDRQEHSLEVILPFLQTRLPAFELIPVVVGPCDAAAMAQAVAPMLRNPRTLLVVSADLSHGLPYDDAVERDRETLDRIISLDPNWQADQANRSCGRYPVGVLLELARKGHWRPLLLHYSNSGDTSGDKAAVVGYGAVAFYGDEPMPNQSDDRRMLTPEQGAALVTLARQTLAAHFGETAGPADDRQLAMQLADGALQARCGTFVTLKMDDQLRGCIGSLSATAPIVSGVRDNALNAALHDPRFPPLGKKELDRVHIEVSVLSEPAPLAYTDAADLLSRLRPGIDGVILKKGLASATFLPQVWEQLPQPESFLSHLCMKAGLPADGWREGDLTVLVYQVQYFEEDR